jgi:manganese efflux pump family protein
LRSYAATVAVTGAVLAAVATGCSSQPAVTGGSVSSCYQFALGAIQRHVTVTAVPAACQGLSQAEVNAAVHRALQTEAAKATGKVRQRQVIGRDSRYVAGLIRVVPAPTQPAVAAPQSHPPGRAALSLAALVAWLVTVGLGASMMARWITRTWWHGQQPRHGRGPALNFTHFGLALTGLVTWIIYLATSVTGLAWAACGLLVAVASLGVALVFLAPASSPASTTASAPASSPVTPAATAGPAAPHADDPPPVGRPPLPVVAAHIIAACTTILLAVLAAVGSG